MLPLQQLIAQTTLGQQGRFSLYFAEYDVPEQRPRILRSLHQQLSEGLLQVVSLQDTRLDLNNLSIAFFDQLKTLAFAEAKTDALFALLLTDWEQRIALDKPLSEQPESSLISIFNLGREHFATCFPHPVVIFLPQVEMLYLQSLAPDFVSWQSGLVYFPLDSEEIHTQLVAAINATQGDNTEQAACLRELLDEASALNPTQQPTEQMGQGYRRLAELYLDLKSWGLAEVTFQALMSWAKTHKKRWFLQAWWGARKAAANRSARLNNETIAWSLFKGASALTETDKIVGREEDLRQLNDRIFDREVRCVTLWGQTGVGKSSFVQAALMPSLRNQGYAIFRQLHYQNPAAELCRVLGLAHSVNQDVWVSIRSTLRAQKQRNIVILDQFERLFLEPKAQVDAYLRAIANLIEDVETPLCCILVLRADTLWHLTQFDPHLYVDFLPLARKNRYELRWLRPSDAARVLANIGKTANTDWEGSLVKQVIQDLASTGKGVRSVEIQLVAAGLYLRHIHKNDQYIQIGLTGLIQSYMNAVLDLCRHSILARQVLRCLVTPTDPPSMRLCSAELIVQETRIKAIKVNAIIDDLIRANVIEQRMVSDALSYQLVHDELVKPALVSTTSQAIGVSVLERSLDLNRWFLSRWHEFRLAIRCNKENFQAEQQKMISRLLRRTWGFYAAITLTTLVSSLIVTQWTTAHFEIVKTGTEPVLLNRGWPLFKNLPGFLSGKRYLDTGFTTEDLNFGVASMPPLYLVSEADSRAQWLERILPSLNPSQKIQVLGRLGRWSDVEAVLLSLDNTVWYEEISIELGKQFRLDSQNVMKTLQSVTKARPEMGRQLARLLVEHGKNVFAEKNISLLMPTFEQGDKLRTEFSTALRSWIQGYDDDVFLMLAQWVKSDSQDVRLFTVGVLNQWVIPELRKAEVLKLLEPLLSDNNLSVRLKAIEGVIELSTGEGGKAEVLKLLEPLLSDNNLRVRLKAIEGVIQLSMGEGGEARLLKLLEPLLSDSESYVRLKAIEGVIELSTGEGGKAEVLKLLEPLLSDDDSDVRWAVVEKLSQLSTTKVRQAKIFELLEPLLSDNNSAVRKKVVENLSELSTTEVRKAEVFKLLQPLLSDNDSDVRWVVVEKLSQLSTTEIRQAEFFELLKPMLSDKNWAVRGKTIEKLGQLSTTKARQTKAFEWFQALLLDENTEVNDKLISQFIGLSILVDKQVNAYNFILNKLLVKNYESYSYFIRGIVRLYSDIKHEPDFIKNDVRIQKLFDAVLRTGDLEFAFDLGPLIGEAEYKILKDNLLNNNIQARKNFSSKLSDVVFFKKLPINIFNKLSDFIVDAVVQDSSLGAEIKTKLLKGIGLGMIVHYSQEDNTLETLQNMLFSTRSKNNASYREAVVQALVLWTEENGVYEVLRQFPNGQTALINKSERETRGYFGRLDCMRKDPTLPVWQRLAAADIQIRGDFRYKHELQACTASQ